MSAPRDTARRALMEAAILKELAARNEVTREDLRTADLEPGDKLNVSDLGYVQVTNPKPTLKVVDWTALTKWIEDNAPDVGIITRTEVSSYFVAQLLKSGEWINADGEVLTPDGIGLVQGAPTLRVAPSDAAHAAARELLGGQLALPSGGASA